MTQDYLQNRKDILKRKLEIFNNEMGNLCLPEEIEGMFKLIDSLDKTEFESLSWINVLMENDGFESGYINGVCDGKKKQKKE